MSAPRYCSKCGKPLRRDDDGEAVRCVNGHSQEPEGVARALIEIVPVLLDLRERLKGIEQTGGRTEASVEELREDVDSLAAVVTPPAEPAALVGMEEVCRLLGVTRDWVYRGDRRRKLGGYQDGKGGRWRFDPDRTRALYAQLYGPPGVSPSEASAPHCARRAQSLPSKVPLLPVQGRDAA